MMRTGRLLSRMRYMIRTERGMIVVTITFSIVSLIGGFVLGFIIGIAIVLWACWRTECDINASNQWSVGFDKGWKAGREYGENHKGDC